MALAVTLGLASRGMTNRRFGLGGPHGIPLGFVRRVQDHPTSDRYNVASSRITARLDRIAEGTDEGERLRRSAAANERSIDPIARREYTVETRRVRLQLREGRRVRRIHDSQV